MLSSSWMPPCAAFGPRTWCSLLGLCLLALLLRGAAFAPRAGGAPEADEGPGAALPASAGLPTLAGAEAHHGAPAERYYVGCQHGWPATGAGWEEKRAYDYQVADASPDQAVSFYQTALTRQGWVLVCQRSQRSPTRGTALGHVTESRTAVLSRRNPVLVERLLVGAYRVQGERGTRVYLRRHASLPGLRLPEP